MSEIRITALGNGSGIEVFYKTDSAKDGWCSRPAPTIPCHSWQRLFEHPTSPANQGFLEYSGNDYFTIIVITPGRRQEWQYNIRYFGGDTQSFTLRCPSLPFRYMSLTEVQKRIQCTILQDPKKDYISDLKCAQQNIVTLLRIREDTEYIASWNTFFNSIPVKKSNVHQSYENILLILATQYGGKIKLREHRFTTFKR